MRKFAIVADDLTGALDTAAQFAHRGLQTMCTLRECELRDVAVVAFSTDTRNLTDPGAYQRVRAAVQPLRSRTVYKKIDSTLRGPIGAELDGLLDELALSRALVAPSFPTMGRVLVDGVLYVGGVPFAAHGLGRDSGCRVRQSHVPSILAGQTRRTVGHLSLAVVEQGAAAIAKALMGIEAEVVVADAAAPQHLLALGQALTYIPEHWLPCGSAGLAQGWLDALGLIRTPKSCLWPPHAGAVLVVAGSRHPATLSQLRRAHQESALLLVSLSPNAGEQSELLSLVVDMLGEEHSVGLTTALASYCPGAELDAAEALGQAAAWVCRHAPLAGLLLTGGDTANAVCTALEAHAISVVGEVQPGIPAGTLVGGQGDGLRLVTKAGGFGDELAIMRGMDFILGRPQSEMP